MTNIAKYLLNVITGEQAKEVLRTMIANQDEARYPTDDPNRRLREGLAALVELADRAPVVWDPVRAGTQAKDYLQRGVFPYGGGKSVPGAKSPVVLAMHTDEIERALSPLAPSTIEAKRTRTKNKRAKRAPVVTLTEHPRVFESRAYAMMRYADRVVAKLPKAARKVRWRTIVENHAKTTFRQATKAEYRAYRRIIARGMQSRGYIKHG